EARRNLIPRPARALMTFWLRHLRLVGFRLILRDRPLVQDVLRLRFANEPRHVPATYTVPFEIRIALEHIAMAGAGLEAVRRGLLLRLARAIQLRELRPERLGIEPALLQLRNG